MEKTETKGTMIQITMKGNEVITAFIPQDSVSLTSGWRALRQEFLVSRRSLPFTVILSATIPRKANADFGGLSASPVVSFHVFTGGIVLFLAHELARHSLRISPTPLPNSFSHSTQHQPSVRIFSAPLTIPTHHAFLIASRIHIPKIFSHR